MSSRQILRTTMGSRQQVRDLLESLFVAELIRPSAHLYLVSPWVRDIEMLDNRSGAFRGIDPSWKRSRLRMSDLLKAIVERGSKVSLATRPLPENRDFVDRVVAGLNSADGERVYVNYRDNLHAKGLVGGSYALTGSMNFTHNGVENLDELLRFETEPAKVAELRTAFAAEYGAPT